MEKKTKIAAPVLCPTPARTTFPARITRACLFEVVYNPVDRSRELLTFVTRACDAEINLRRAVSRGHVSGKSNEWVEAVNNQLGEVLTTTKVGWDMLGV